MSASQAIRDMDALAGGGGARPWTEGGWGRCHHRLDGREIRETPQGWVIRSGDHLKSAWKWLDGEPVAVGKDVWTGRTLYQFPPKVVAEEEEER